MIEGLAKVKNYLEEKSINYQIKDDVINIPYEVNNKKFMSKITFHGKWLIYSALLVKREQIPDENYNELLKDLLIANHELPEINYDISREGDVFTSVDMKISILNTENFFSEYYAIPFGIKNFVKSMVPKFEIKI